MFRIFKSFRKKSISDQISSGYYKYALGEVLLVMVGILLALQVDNWNEERKEKKLEEQILINLHAEVKANVQIIERVIVSKKKVLNACRRILEQTGPDNFWQSSMEFDSLLAWAIVSGFKYFPETGVMSDFINSGKVSLLENDSLRKLITSLPHDILLIQDEESVYRNELHTYFLPFVGKHYPTRIIAPRLHQFQLDYSTGSSRFNAQPEQLLNNMEFESMLNTQYIWFTIALSFYDDLKSKYRIILELIETELAS